MEFIRINNPQEGVQPLADRLVSELSAGKKVLWLLSGGSNIPISVAVMQQIPDDLTASLTVMLVDERYGEPGHPDSNSKQLEDAGFDHKQARVTYVLAPGLSQEETAEQFALGLGAAFEVADTVIAQLGMGPDGHVLGILPGSPAVDSDKMVVSYTGPDYQRITPTAKAAIEHYDVAYVFTFGEAKRSQLEKLRDENVPLAKQPAQLLKQLPEAYVYNDQLSG